MTTKYSFEAGGTAYEFRDQHEHHQHLHPKHHHHQTRGRAGSSSSGGGAHHRRGRSVGSASSAEGDPLDGTGSLTYSAASSINSATGESTDSSFGDIMRVLDVQDSKELASYLKTQKAGMMRSGGDNRSTTKDERSITADSLAYSDAESYLRSLAATDGGESLLHGADLISTITG